MAYGPTARKPVAPNVVVLDALRCKQPLAQRLAAHARLFAKLRRCDGDVFWLKENAEFLNVLRSTTLPGDAILDIYEPIHACVDVRLAEFPQYYRFHLSICLDLEDLGMPGDKGTDMCEWVAAQGLVQAELSDLQRAEARHLLSRRGVWLADRGLNARLHRFMERSRTFGIPNRKAAYELTHIVFYLSDYGRRDTKLGSAIQRSLAFAGLLAFLDQNHDLLAEICIALRFADQTPPPIWERAVMANHRTARERSSVPGNTADDYHTYLMTSWLAGLSGSPPLPIDLRDGHTRIEMAPPANRPLREMGRALPVMESGDWAAVRDRIIDRMTEGDRSLLDDAERSTDLFAEFYEVFARIPAPVRH